MHHFDAEAGVLSPFREKRKKTHREENNINRSIRTN
jgi:hypothetical protein